MSGSTSSAIAIPVPPIVNAVLGFALPGMKTQLAGPVLVARDHPPGVLDPLSIARHLQARLAREVALPQSDRMRLDAEMSGDLGQAHGVRRRRPDADGSTSPAIIVSRRSLLPTPNGMVAAPTVSKVR